MKLPMQWIKDYASIPVDAKTYQNRMIWTGTAVEGVEALGEDIEKVVAGRVLTVDKVEGSDHLHVCTVDAGQGAILQIVCGAPNVAPGILVPVALEGAKLPGGVKIKKGKLRGVMSEGMLCSATELNVPQELYPSVGDAGLLVFREEYPLGTDVKAIFGLDDTVIDFEILANRPDCLCVWGVARETAVALKTSFQKPSIHVTEADGSIHSYVKVTVKDTDFCPRYVARVVKNVRVGPSPLWLRKYLYGAGMRSINNVVDITNFVMLETGHPMHAFDLGKVRGGEIIVRKAKAGEIIKTLDGKERELTGIELLICDGEGPTGVAGIMGGEESEITQSTATLMFECAAFDRTGTRLAARSLGMRTEASGRFEKGVSPKTALEAMQRACQMINLLDAGDVVPGIIDIYPNPQKPQAIHASLKRIAKRTGVDIPAQAMVDILKSLHFEVKVNGDEIVVTVPEFRQDVEGEADLSEEVLRVYGYESIPATRLRGESTPGGRSAVMRFRDALGLRLNGLGYSEIMNFSFISQKSIEKLNLAKDDERLRPLKLLNPLGEDTRVMRPSLVPGMLQTLALNMNRGNEKAWLYEIAAVYNASKPTAENLPTETLTLCMGIYGGRADFYTLRDDVQTLLANLGIRADIAPGGESYHHPGRCAVLTVNGQKLAVLGEVHPDTREAFDMPERALIAEMDLNLARALAVSMGDVTPLPRYPAVSRDLALVMPDSQPVGPVMAAMEKAAGALLEECRMFDVYRGAQLGEGKKSVAFSLSFRAADHTLTEAEITGAMDKVLKACEKEFGAAIRA
jgi:phenylalanyl-tRNA synthetase beta chain